MLTRIKSETEAFTGKLLENLGIEKYGVQMGTVKIRIYL